ncbi:MAG TPA: DUF4845 domain-containing protein [Pseudomonadales bacterium]|nr:DUF4845 domain-containing protein [Pseudomonadales bacterium]
MRNKQGGASGLNVLFTIVMVVMVGMVALKLIPVYLDNYTIKGALDSLNEQAGITQMTPEKIKSILSNQLQINNVHNLDPKSIVIKKYNGRLTVNIDYEVRIDLVQNVDLLVSFENKFEAVAH